jgi:hypothetical protein
VVRPLIQHSLFRIHRIDLKNIQPSLESELKMTPAALLPDPRPGYVLFHAGKGTINRQMLTGDENKTTLQPSLNLTY